MTKGTPSEGKKSGKVSHIRCRRCGYPAYHRQARRCAKCGFPDAKIRKYAWQSKRLGKRLF
ncbi:MAG: 50S ribosomal protein L37e [DPANN group archaeon]|nr:50S ribosomal protein L37e [DPANN group archaeon]